VLTAVVALTALVAGPGAPQTSAEAVARLQATYQDTADLQARFSQVYRYKVNGLERKSSGRVWVKKPGRMRWDYETPNRRHFISNGTTLWVYTPDTAQVYEEPLARSQAASALSFLLGQGDVEATFDHELLPPDETGNVRLELVPKAGSGQFRKVVLSLDPQAFRVVRSEVTDPVGNLNRLTFTELKVNQGLPESGFTFTPPPGTRVVKAPGDKPAE